MTWQGIPYKLISNEAVETVNLALRSIPKIVIDSPPDYTSPIITAVVSVIAGAIPACIAIWTFKRNSRNTKSEREAQQRFLTQERAEQQLFLKEERAAQIASTEKDREAQLAIAKQNFNMQVLSVNRQAWINNLRDLLADYSSIAPELLNAKFNYLNKKGAYDTVLKKLQENTDHSLADKYQKLFSHHSSELNISMDNFEIVKGKATLLVAKIKLMLSPKEHWYAELNREFNVVEIIYNTFTELDMSVYSSKIAELDNCLDSVLKISQGLLKYEWERVKQGV
ncbi:hypothetical protein [Serratia fonticola]|uniref:hypothetical protein n=1 Tax=Serratia fonticola TaxID=47917 RepID=UPI0027EA4622|nr:hypothetical protein [Serratia fonticola]MDQ7207392.1 hypothetical protein [Serratia fonticola]HBE9077626.1 hypothetical protein [Serratia fonticola]HBE9088197.1 hypothetical protein [Serratia fonticola]HBE9150355.1 hypothetical protein [Serratia fonticola]